MVTGSVIKNKETLFILDVLSKGFAEEKGDLVDWNALFKKTIEWGIAPYFLFSHPGWKEWTYTRFSP